MAGPVQGHSHPPHPGIAARQCPLGPEVNSRPTLPEPRGAVGTEQTEAAWGLLWVPRVSSKKPQRHGKAEHVGSLFTASLSPDAREPPVQMFF